VVTVYGIEANNELVYVGVTRRSLCTRLNELIYRHKWLQAKPKRPEIFEIEVVEDCDKEEAEQHCIAYFRSIGCKLMNIAIGGKSSTGVVNSMESNELRRGAALGRKHTEETKRKIGLANTGNSRPDVAERNKLGRNRT